MSDYVSSAELVDSVDGMTYRQLDYWARQGYITPAVDARGSGSRRKWDRSLIDDLNQRVASTALLDNMHTLKRRVLTGEILLEIRVTERQQ